MKFARFIEKAGRELVRAGIPLHWDLIYASQDDNDVSGHWSYIIVQIDDRHIHYKELRPDASPHIHRDLIDHYERHENTIEISLFNRRKIVGSPGLKVTVTENT